MVSLRRRRYHVIYPEYFDIDRSRSEGRRVNLKLASKDPSLAKIAKACQILEIEYEIEKDKVHPSNWWNKQGRLLLPIDKTNKANKEALLKHVAQILPKLVSKKKPTQKSEAKTKQTTGTRPATYKPKQKYPTKKKSKEEQLKNKSNKATKQVKGRNKPKR
jgi:signal recognition particle subunit SRP19